jgi:hypothetical protein
MFGDDHAAAFDDVRKMLKDKLGERLKGLKAPASDDAATADDEKLGEKPTAVHVLAIKADEPDGDEAKDSDPAVPPSEASGSDDAATDDDSDEPSKRGPRLAQLAMKKLNQLLKPKSAD